MHAQPDLFEVSAGVSPTTVFPKFEIERPNCDYSGHIKLPDMPAVLKKLGFSVGPVRHYAGTVLVFPVGPCEEKSTLFEVTYPEGWTLTDDLSLTVYTGDHNPVRQILDARGHLRGIVHCSCEKMPVAAKLYTRYCVWSGVPLNFAQLPFDREGIRSVAVDRTKLDPKHPSKLSNVEHIDRRWLLAEKYPALRDMPPEERRTWFEKNVCDYRVEESGSSLWLDEHFPNWRDPAAYWP